MPNKEILHSEHLGIHAVSPFIVNSSSPRNVMFSGHMSQRLVIEGCDEEIIQTGVSRELGKYTFSVTMPVNGNIIKVIEKYPKNASINSLAFNPETIIIYENDDTKEIDYIRIPYYNSLSQFFGYKYNINEDAVNLIRHGNFIPKGTIFADSPAVKENGGYAYGVNLNTAFMSLSSVSNDGMAIADDVLDKLKFNVYETRIIQFGTNCFPLNIHGTKYKYQPFPEIGDKIRDDGILAILRDYEQDTVPANFNLYSTMEPDMMFDVPTYVRGGGGRIVDIEVIGNNNPNKNLPEAMREQVVKYQNAYLRFCREIIATDKKIRENRKKAYGVTDVKLSHKFHNLVTECLAITNYNEDKYDQRLLFQYKKSSTDEYRVKFVIEYTITPALGYKLTDTSGGLPYESITLYIMIRI